MADSLETPSFGIMDTMEMGIGNQELLSDLMSPETSTGDPDKVQPIIKEVEEPKQEPPKKEPKVKEVAGDEGEKKSTGEQIIASFLGSDEDDEEEEEPVAKAPVEEPEEEEVSQFAALSKDLFKLGVFTNDEDEEEVVINSPEEFLERFNAEKKKGAIEVVNNFIGQFGEDYQQAFDAIFVKGVNPREYFGTYNNIVNLAELDLSVEDNQVAIIKRALDEQGFEPEDITTEIERLKNYGDLESVAAKHHKVLVKRDSARLKQLEENAQRELQQKAAVRNQYIQNVQSILQEKLKTKEFDGIPINPKLATELQDFLLVDKYKTASGETLTDFDKTILELKRPENHAMKVKIALLLKILEKDPTLSTIQKSGVTKRTDQLFGEVARQVTKSKTNVQPRKSSWFSE
mgnify:CR=1 FL=1